MTSALSIGVIADDFTGAMDTGAQFARCGLRTLLVLAGEPAALVASPVVTLNTASREIPSAEAHSRAHAAAEQLRGRRLFKKIDSTLRGSIAAELQGLLNAQPGAKIVLCPAAPQQGRVVQDGRLYVNGLPLDQSIFSRDPVFPAKTSLVAERIGISATHLPLSIVRGPVGELAKTIASAPNTVVIADAVNDVDLQHISQAAIQVEAIPCGAFGLANAWARALTGRQPEQTSFAFPAADRPVLIVAGSANTRTHQQIAALRSHADSRLCPVMVPLPAAEEEKLHRMLSSEWPRLRTVVLSPALEEIVPAVEWLAFASSVSRLAAELIRRQQPAGLIIAGGETANALCAELGVQAVALIGEAAPGIPLGRLVGGPAGGLILVSKAGGFGQDDCLEKLIYP